MSRRRQAVSAEPNLTPILDMVFQLITFFMLVVSFKTASMDPNVRLPVLGSGQPSHPEADRNYVVLNIDTAGALRVLGQAVDLDAYLAQEVDTLKEAAQLANPAFDPNSFRVAAVIRADRETPFTHLHRVFTACKEHGFRDVTLKVMDAASKSGSATSADQVAKR